MQFFKADYIHPQKMMAFTGELDKIEFNLTHIRPLANAIVEKRRVSPKMPNTQMTVSGRWIVVYSENGVNDEDTMMYFADFRSELDGSAISHVVSAAALGNMKVLQFKYDEVYKDSMDTMEISYCEPDEQILKRNLVTCSSDDKVLIKAQALGVLPIIETLKEPDKLKVSLVDEKIQDGDNLIINIYALIHFGKTETENSGFAYLKLYDLLNNYDLTDDFLLALENMGGKFERVFFMEKFKPERWN